MVRKAIHTWKEKLKEHFRQVISIKRSPSSIAAGLAVGAFIAIVPTPGFNILIAIGVTLIFEKISKISLFLALLLFNPITTLPFSVLGYNLGKYLLGSAPVVESGILMWDSIYYHTIRYMLGMVIVALVVSLFLYLAVYVIASFYLKRDHSSRR